MDTSQMPSLTELLRGGGTNDEITVCKAADVIAGRGYQPSGIVLCHPKTGERCIVEMGCVRWMSKNDAWTLMHGPVVSDDANAARRYETVRKLSVNDFAALYAANLRGEGRFDDLVDALAAGRPPNAKVRGGEEPT